MCIPVKKSNEKFIRYIINVRQNDIFIKGNNVDNYEIEQYSSYRARSKTNRKLSKWQIYLELNNSCTININIIIKYYIGIHEINLIEFLFF